MGRTFSEAELRTTAPIFLVDLELGGVVYRFATESQDIETDSGSVFYDGTLSDVNFASSLQFASPDFELPSAGVTVTFKIDLAKRIAQGLDFGAARGTLALWLPGTDLDDRQVIIDGRIDAPSYGAIGEPVSFNIEADFLRNTKLIPNALQVIDSATWPNVAENSEGEIYPIIIGAPGRQGFAGSPIYVAQDLGSGTDRVGIIAAHQCTAGTISIMEVKADGTTPAVPDRTVAFGVDLNGAAYSYITIPNANFNDDATYFARWDTGGGGLVNPYANQQDADAAADSAYLTGGGDVVRYLLHRSGAVVDDGRMAAASGYLNFIQFEGYIAERVDAMEFLQEEILPLLPCSLRAGPDGLYVVPWRYDATETDARTKLEAGRDMHRDGLVEYVSSEVYNEISLRYRHNVKRNKLTKAVTITGDTSKKPGGFLWRNTYTINSEMRYGTKALELETEFISSRVSAGRVVNWMSRAYGARQRRIKYEAPHRLAWLEVGDVVAVTDSDLSLTDQLLILESIEWGETALILSFLFVPDSPRDNIPTG